MNIVDKIIDCVEESMEVTMYQGDPIPILEKHDREAVYYSIINILDEYKYKKGFDILMEYWDCIPEEERMVIDKRLQELGL